MWKEEGFVSTDYQQLVEDTNENTKRFNSKFWNVFQVSLESTHQIGSITADFFMLIYLGCSNAMRLSQTQRKWPVSTSPLKRKRKEIPVHL